MLMFLATLQKNGWLGALDASPKKIPWNVVHITRHGIAVDFLMLGGFDIVSVTALPVLCR